MVTAHLTELESLGIAGERCARRIEPQSVGSLVEVRRAELRVGDRLRAARHAAEVERTGEFVPAARKTMAEVQSAHVRAAVQVG